MKISQIQYFLKVAEMQNIQKAAELLFISPQALSKSIIGLEEELNSHLFTRHKHHLELTPLGRQIYLELIPFSYEYDNTMSRIYNLIDQEKGNITLICAEGSLSSLSYDPISKVKQYYPEANIEVLDFADVLVEDYLLNKNADFGLTTSPLNPNKFDVTLLSSSNICIVVRKDHPLASKKKVSIEEVSKYPIQAKNKLFNTYLSFDNYAKSKQIPITYATSKADYNSWKKNVINEDIVALGVDYIPVSPKDNMVILQLEEHIPWNVYLNVRKEYKPTPIVEYVLKALKNED